MKIRILAFVLLSTTLGAFAQDKEDDRLKNSYTVLKEILAMPDKGIPHDLLNKAVCVIIYPSVLKAAFIVCIYCRRQLRPRRHHLPHWRRPQRPVECPRDVCA